MPSVPHGDILLHAGDLTNKGSFNELQAQLDWLNGLPHAHKIVVAGNHDLLLDADFCDRFPYRVPSSADAKDLEWGSIMYLKDTSVTLTIHGREIVIYGSPWMPDCGSWAFQHPAIRDVWKDMIPTETDILLTHGPPKGHLDEGGKGWRGIEELGWDYPQKVYDGVQVGDMGLISVLAMSVFFVAQKLLSLVCGRGTSSTTLVNAAVVAGPGNVESRPAAMVEI